MAEQHPRGCHPWHDDVPRIGEFAEFVRVVHKTDKECTLPTAENDNLTIDRPTRLYHPSLLSESLLMHSIYREIRLRCINGIAAPAASIDLLLAYADRRTQRIRSMRILHPIAFKIESCVLKRI